MNLTLVLKLAELLTQFQNMSSVQMSSARPNHLSSSRRQENRRGTVVKNKRKMWNLVLECLGKITRKGFILKIRGKIAFLGNDQFCHHGKFPKQQNHKVPLHSKIESHHPYFEFHSLKKILNRTVGSNIPLSFNGCRHNDYKVVSPALRAVGNIVTGDDIQTQV